MPAIVPTYKAFKEAAMVVTVLESTVVSMNVRKIWLGGSHAFAISTIAMKIFVGAENILYEDPGTGSLRTGS